MKTAERIVMVLLLLCIFGGVAWLYFTLTSDRASLRDAVARGEYEIRTEPTQDEAGETQEDWRRFYPSTIPITIGSTTVAASVADTLPERIQGLSDTPYLPEGLVKLFVFGAEGTHAIWMKDMQYTIDILWATKEGEIVHIEESVSPDTYPDSFSSPVPAWYVVEANAGFVEANEIEIGDTMKVVPPAP